MPETILIDALAGTLSEGFCPTGPGELQELYDEFVAKTQWSLAVGIKFYNYGDTEPTPDFRIYPWLRTIAGEPDKWYVYVGAAMGPNKWLSLHPIPAGPNGLRQGWVGTEDELKVFDGGEVGVTTLVSGSFWEIDHDFDGRSPMGPGVIPAANPAKVLSVAEDYGDGARLQTANETSPHSHPITSAASISHDGVVDVVPSGAGADDGLLIGGSGVLSDALTVGQNTYTASQEAMSIIHPVRGLFKIKRTIRKFYRSA